MTRLQLPLILLAALLFAGCSTLRPEVEFSQPTNTPPPVAVAPAPVASNNGAIFQAASYRPMFEDYRARLVGDTITVQITENISASQTSSSSVDRSGSVDAGLGSLFGLSSRTLDRVAVNGSSSNTHAGKGNTTTNNKFSGSITASVTDVLPNGHLLIAGEKQIGVNGNVDTLRFTGQVDPRTIAPGNVVASTQVANVRLQQKGRGQQADAQFMGWLARFFLSVLPI